VKDQRSSYTLTRSPVSLDARQVPFLSMQPLSSPAVD
jgi:hypothetical protein